MKWICLLAQHLVTEREREERKSLIWVIRKNKDLPFIRKMSAIGRGH